MKIKYQQKTKGGCGLYCLANFFDNEVFLHYKDHLDRGHNTHEINVFLQKHEPEWYLETVFQTSYEFTKQANRLLDDYLFGLKQDQIDDFTRENCAAAKLVSFKRTPEKDHYILAIQNIKDNRIYVFNPLLENRIDHSIQEFIDLYHILSVEYLCVSTHQDWTVINKSAFRHLFAEGE